MSTAETLELFYGPPLEVVSSSLRGMIVSAPGKDFVAADFSAIEARVLAWLSGQEDVLDLFRNKEDVYCAEASGIFGRTIVKSDSADRQIGKVAILALGYQGGIGAFAEMAAGYGVDLEPVYPTLWASATEEERGKAKSAYASHLKMAKDPVSRKFGLAADIIKQRWRRKNAKTVRFWYDLEEAAQLAVKNPGKTYKVGRIRYKVAGSFLWCQLPSGRCLCYPYPIIKKKKMPWTDQDGNPVYKDSVFYKGVDSVTKKWGLCDLYGGLQAENITQGVARDLLAEALLRAEDAGYPVVMHIHDDIVAEVAEGWGSVDALERLMSLLPQWAQGLPIAAEGWRGKRFRK